MLIQLTAKVIDPIAQLIAEVNGNSSDTIELEAGVYQIGHFNFENELPVNLSFDEKYPDLSCGSYGVCDHYGQIFAKIPELLNSQERAFIVSVTEIVAKDQSPEGGWRWHKWGGYIGNHEPQCEYIYDEPEIEKVYVYHIYELTNHVKNLVGESPKQLKSDLPFALIQQY